MTDNWNYDMSAAPRGNYITRTQKGKDGEPVEVTAFISQKVILGGACGTVTVSRWLPDEQRWEMFSNKETPLAWQPYPDPPKPLEVAA